MLAARAGLGAWLTADAPGILHPAGPGRGGGRAVGSVFPLAGAADAARADDADV